MLRIHLVLACLLILSADKPETPEDAVRRFCKWEFEGGRLTPAGGSQEGGLFLHAPESRPPIRSSDIEVVRDYVVKLDSRQGHTVYVVVDYARLGYFDDSLQFIRTEGRLAHQPSVKRQYVDLISQPDWKIVSYTSRQRLGVDAAIRYLSGMRDAASSASVRDNAGRSIDALRRLVTNAGDSTDVGTDPQESAWSVAKKFCRLDADGARLTAEGRRAIAALLAHPVSPASLEPDTIAVVDDVGVGDAEIASDDTAGVVTEAMTLGHLNLKTGGFAIDVPGGVRMREELLLVLADTKPAGTRVWKISSPLHAPRVTVDAAIRYVTALRDTTADPTARRAAQQALAALRRQR